MILTRWGNSILYRFLWMMNWCYNTQVGAQFAQIGYRRFIIFFSWFCFNNFSVIFFSKRFFFSFGILMCYRSNKTVDSSLVKEVEEKFNINIYYYINKHLHREIRWCNFERYALERVKGYDDQHHIYSPLRKCCVLPLMIE